jgi:hypothetical protein
MKPRAFLSLCFVGAALLVSTGCESVRSDIRESVREKIAGPQYRERVFSGDARATFDAARRAVVAMGFRVDRAGGAAQGKIVAFSGLQSGQDLAASRQIRLQIEISPYGTESRVRALLTEVLEADFARGPGHATENGLKDTPLYEVLFRRIEEGLKQP